MLDACNVKTERISSRLTSVAASVVDVGFCADLVENEPVGMIRC